MKGEEVGEEEEGEEEETKDGQAGIKCSLGPNVPPTSQTIVETSWVFLHPVC